MKFPFSVYKFLSSALISLNIVLMLYMSLCCCRQTECWLWATGLKSERRSAGVGTHRDSRDQCSRQDTALSPALSHRSTTQDSWRTLVR